MTPDEKIIKQAISDLIQNQKNMSHYLDITNQRIDEVWKGLAELKIQLDNRQPALMS